MKIEDHQKNLKESLEVIEESIEKGVEERQRNIGFNISAASVDYLEILLHKNNLIDPGFIIKHEWLNSENKIREKFPFEFTYSKLRKIEHINRRSLLYDNCVQMCYNLRSYLYKEEILRLMSKIEGKRNQLCYGKPQKKELIIEVINLFNVLKKKFREAGLNEF